MKIYTRTGDEGETALFGGGRVGKTHPRVRAYGTVDELNSFLGRAVLSVRSPEIRERLGELQHDLFALGSNLATPPRPGGGAHPHVPPLPLARIQAMEEWMDAAEEELPPLRNFILPGGSAGAADLHVCRTVCRRAERIVVELGEVESGGAGGVSVSGGAPPADPRLGGVVRYLNRLSDLLFTLARLENLRAGAPDVEWRKDEAAGEVP
jgi:cob(I)alamin adenosyltransferase